MRFEVTSEANLLIDPGVDTEGRSTSYLKVCLIFQFDTQVSVRTLNFLRPSENE